MICGIKAAPDGVIRVPPEILFFIFIGQERVARVNEIQTQRDPAVRSISVLRLKLRVAERPSDRLMDPTKERRKKKEDPPAKVSGLHGRHSIIRQLGVWDPFKALCSG